MVFLGKLLNLVSMAATICWTGFCAFWHIIGFSISEEAGHRAHRAWARGCCFLMGVHVRFEELENWPQDTAVVVAPNHSSMWDIMVLATLPFRFKWISKKEVKRLPLFGYAMNAMGCYFVSRDKSGKDLNIMKGVEDGLRNGVSVVIFPEGTRTRTGELLPFKKGAFRTAQNAGVPLLPVAIRGTFEIAPPGELPSKRGHHVTVRLGKPYRPPGGRDLTIAMEEYRGILLELLGQNRNALR